MIKVQPTSRKGLLSYFQSEFGRKIVVFAAGTTAISIFVGNYLPQTFCLKHYKNFVQSYENGLPRPVPEKLRSRVDQALDLLNINGYERKLIKPFTVYGFDLFQAGSTKYRFGAILGIPINYGYLDANDIKRNEIFLHNANVNLNWENAKLLENSLVLTEDEQIFGLCKAILQLQTHRVLLNSLFPSLSFIMVYSVGNYLNLRLNLMAKHFSVRFVMYSILGLFGIGSWFFMKDFNQVTYDADIDKTLAALGPEFIDAGVRYYDKMLKRNMALRELIGGDTYTAKGNENYLLRQKSLPLTIRKSFFEEKWKELKESTKNSTEEQQQ